MLIMNLSAAKLAKDQQKLQSLERKNSEMSSLMKQCTEELDVMSGKLEDLMKKIKEASTTLLHYSNQVKSKKLLVKYYDTKLPMEGKDKSTSDVLCDAIENALSFLKGKHCTAKAKLLVEGLMSVSKYSVRLGRETQADAQEEPSLGSQAYDARTA
jgi:hypothetical protein